MRISGMDGASLLYGRKTVGHQEMLVDTIIYMCVVVVGLHVEHITKFYDKQLVTATEECIVGLLTLFHHNSFAPMSVIC